MAFERVDLSRTSRRGYAPGRSIGIRALWLIVEALVLRNPLLPLYAIKRFALRLFGADIETGVLIKPGVRVKYPWRLSIGANSWIGEGAWLDNMEDVRIGSNVVVSQGAYICTGNHDWGDSGMPLTPSPVVVEDGVWIGAFARVAPGVRVREASVLVIGAVLLESTEPYQVYVGNPARNTTQRKVRS